MRKRGLVCGLLLAVSVVSGQFLETVIDVPSGVESLLYHPATNALYVGGSGEGQPTVVIGGASNAIEAVIPVGCEVTEMAASEAEVYCAASSSHEIVVLDAVSRTVHARIPTRTVHPWRIAYGSGSCKVYSLSEAPRDSALIVADAIGDTLIRFVGLVDNPYLACYNSTNDKLYIASAEGDVVIVLDCVTDSVVAALPLAGEPYAVAYNPTSNRVYAVSYAARAMIVIDGATDSVVATLPMGSGATGTCVDPVLNKVYCAFEDDSTVYVVDAGADTVEAVVPVGDHPQALACDPNRHKVYCAASHSDDVTVIDGITNTVLAVIPTPGVQREYMAAWNPANSRAYFMGTSGRVLVLRDTMPSGVETEEPQARKGGWLRPTVLRTPRLARYEGIIFDITGRAAADRSALRPGVYFLRGERASRTRKVVLAR